MKKETGFTLMELLAVIVILSVITLIVTPVITNLINNSKEKLYQEQIKRIENFSLRYIIDNNTDFLTDGTAQSIELNQLVISGYVQENDIVDPRNDEPLMGCVKTIWDLTANNYLVTYLETCDITDPTVPTLASTSSTLTSITSIYNASSDAESGIDHYTCYYGTTSTPSTIGTVNGTTCTFSNLSVNTTYYYKICATNGANTTTCSTISNKNMTQSSLVLYFKGDSNVTDETGTATATTNGNLTYVSGKIGNAIEFNDETAEYVYFPYNSLYQFANSGAFSISFWYKPMGSTTTLYQSIIGKGLDSDIGCYNAQNGTSLSFRLSGTTIATATTIGAWHHIVLWWDGANMKLYKNNSVVASGAKASMTSNTNGFGIGKIPDRGIVGGTNYNSNGYIDEISVFNRALTTAEISELYNDGNGQSLK